MNREKLEEWLKDISTPTGLSYSGDQTLSNSEVDTILEYVDNLQSKIDKANELIKRKLSTETYQHLKKLYDDIDSTEEIWEDYEFEDLLDILKEDK